MDQEFLEKLFSCEISGEEREMLCEVAYSRSFSECLRKIKHDDFTLGLESGKYKILSIRSTGEKRESVEIRFICTGYGLFEWSESFLYRPRECSIPYDMFGLGGGQIISQPLPPPEYYVTFYKAEIDDAMLAAFRKWSEKNMFSFNNILAIIKTQDKQDGGKKKKNEKRVRV